MRNLYLGLIGALALAAVVGGSAFALFSSQVRLSGIHLAAGNALLQVGSTQTDLHNDTLTPDIHWDALFPGYTASSAFWLKNASSAPISLSVKGQLVGTDGDWDALKTVITLRVIKQGSSSSTGYKTLADWQAEGGISLPGGDLAQNETRGYSLDVQVLSKYADGSLVGNEMANKALTGTSLVFTGTQD